VIFSRASLSKFHMGSSTLFTILARSSWAFLPSSSFSLWLITRQWIKTVATITRTITKTRLTLKLLEMDVVEASCWLFTIVTLCLPGHGGYKKHMPAIMEKLFSPCQALMNQEFVSAKRNKTA